MQASSLTPGDLRFAMFAVKQALAASSALLNLDLTMAAFIKRSEFSSTTHSLACR